MAALRPFTMSLRNALSFVREPFFNLMARLILISLHFPNVLTRAAISSLAP